MSASPAARIDYLARESAYGSLFPTARSAAEREPHRLADAEVVRFHAQGFLHRVPILDPAQLERLRAGLDAIIAGRNGREDELIGRAQEDPAAPTVLSYMQGAWLIDEAIHDLAFHPAITVKVAQLLGAARVRFWHDQVFAKPPRRGGNVAWHQDASYWRRATPAQHLTVWIGLDDSTRENGCVHMVPGSHRWGLLEAEDLMGDMDALRRQLGPERAAAFAPLAIEQPAGTCSFHHDHTIHGSYRNESERPRRAIVLNYMVDGTRSAADDGLMMPGAEPVPKGAPIAGRCFPLVLAADG